MCSMWTKASSTRRCSACWLPGPEPPPIPPPRWTRCARRWRCGAAAPLAGAQAWYVGAARAGLDERRLLAVEALFDAELELGRHGDILPELTARVADNPLREHLVGQLMTALYRCGRQAEALHEYRKVRRRLVDEHGLDPSPALREQERLILTGDRALLSPDAPVPTAEPEADDPDAPAVSALPARSRHLVPPPPAHLVGREPELARVTASLRTGSAGGGARVAVYGPPGVGKTAFALTVAERVRDMYGDGQIFVDLGGLNGKIASRELLAMLLRVLGVHGNAVPDTEVEQVMVLRGLVGGARLLLVLDDVADEAQVRSALSGRWAAVILTSRARLAALEDTEHRRLPVLDEPDAVRLLAIVAPGQVSADPAGAARLAAACGGLPLAVRVAGAKLAARPHWTTSMVADRLADERRQLDELQVGDHAVRASLEVSYAALEPSVQQVFRVVGSLGRTSVEPWLAAAALDVSEVDVVDPLEDLVMAQMLDPARPPAVGYQLHDLVRVFARERFDAVEAPGQSAAIARRVAEALLAVALPAEQALWRQGVHPCGRHPDGVVPDGVVVRGDRLPGIADAVGWLAERRVAASAAVVAAHAEGLWAHCWTLARALVPTLEVGGHYDEWLRLSRVALDAARQAGEPGWAAVIEAGLGTLHHYRADWVASRVALERALAIWPLSGGPADPMGGAYANLVLAMTLRAAGDADTQSLLRASMETGVVERDPVLEVEALRCLAWVDRDQGRQDLAIRRLGQALHRVTDVHDSGHRLRGYVLHDLGVMHAGRHDYEQAIDILGTALRIFERLADRHWTGLSIQRLGEAHHGMGRYDEAIAHLLRARNVFRGLHDQLREASILLALGDLQRELGRHEVAEQYLGTAAMVYERHGQTLRHARVQVSIGELREAQENPAAALAAFEQANRHLAHTRTSPWRDRAVAGLARVRVGQGMPPV